MSQQRQTVNLGFPVPADQSHNAPWGEDDKTLAQAIVEIDAHLGTKVASAADAAQFEARIAAIEAHLASQDVNFKRAALDLAGLKG